MNLDNFDKITQLKITNKKEKITGFKKFLLKLRNCFSKERLIFQLLKATYQANAIEGKLTYEGVKYKDKTYQLQYLVIETDVTKQA